MNDELKQLIEAAAKLLGYNDSYVLHEMVFNKFDYLVLDPLDPERGDLMKVAEAAELCIDGRENECFVYYDDECISEPAWFRYTKGDYQSLVLAVLRAASAVLKARGE